MKKKLLPILLLVVIVFNFILCNSVYADPGESSSSLERYGGNATIKGQAVKDLSETGTDSQGNTFVDGNFGASVLGMVMQYIASIINSFPMTIQGLITMVTMNPDGDGGIGEQALDIANAISNPDYHFTIEKAVFNEIALFNVNVFNQEPTYTIGIGEHIQTIMQHSSNLTLKESTASWFYTCRIMAMMINLCVLVFVGIRMAISTVASEEAKYKKMLINWLESMVVLFLLHYIMLITVEIGEIVLNILNGLRYEIVASGEVSFEDVILQKIYWAFQEEAGIQMFMYSLFFWFLTFMHLKFFLTYFKRTLSIMFLTIIGPFITVTYPIDKMDDGKAQAFEYWFKEYMINIAVQPIHAATYLIFVYTAGKIAEQAPFVAMVFLLSLGRIENIVRNVFGITQSISMKNIDSEMKGKGK